MSEMNDWRKLSTEEKEQLRIRAAEMHQKGSKYSQIGRALGISWGAVSRLIDPEYAQRRALAAKLAREARPHSHDGLKRRPLDRDKIKISAGRPIGGDKRNPILPPEDDPRTFTERFMGDPLPGRGHLARKAGVFLGGTDTRVSHNAEGA